MTIGKYILRDSLMSRGEVLSVLLVDGADFFKDRDGYCS